MSLFKTPDGETSSKRVSGCAILAVALLISFILALFSLKYVASDKDSILTIIEYLLLSGTSLLGVGLLENIKSTFKKKK